MRGMHATVVVFPGSNADAEMIHTLRDVVGVRTSTAWHRDAELPAGTDLVAIPGGFSYGDYLRCGAIARVSPIIAAIRRHAERGGFVLGVCNGFQILTEAGLLPGALTQNTHMRFECRDVFVTTAADGPFTSGLPRVLRLPIAHADGRYQASAETLKQLAGEGRIALRYCDREGRVTDAANPNGSLENIAGIYGGPARNVLGLMPHPERASEALLGNEDGRTIFEAVVRAGRAQQTRGEAAAPAGAP
ncbi:Phosphoribosylformylglycinamidine synthase, glutamine amidotransferase subunit protein [Minicystis rosea]|nr:Phosphoribosylformylglycinamidine synthase, glutamine amidotransferase subunit protein [Minicystis rosea]